ncbi:MAG TPA: hypothetical protein VFT98_08715 [Myxococcota bacterium]|nr:hypothetical protein [Myxococcota bacterium]
MASARRLAAGASALAMLAYPFAIWFALGRLETRTVGLGLLALLALRMLLLAPVRARALGRSLAPPALALAAIAAATAALDAPQLLLLAPALGSLALLLTFARTLREGPPLVEQLARATNPELSASEIEHCRSVTWLWCAFFAANAAAIGALAGWAPRAWWAAYAGFGSYLAVGLLFASEYVVRRARFGRFEDHLLDRALARALGRVRMSP